MSEHTYSEQSESTTGPSNSEKDPLENIQIEGEYPIEEILSNLPGSFTEYEDEYSSGYQSKFSSNIDGLTVSDGKVFVYAFGGQWGGTEITFAATATESLAGKISAAIAPYIEGVTQTKLTDIELQAVQKAVQEGSMTTDFAVTDAISGIGISVFVQDENFTIQIIPQQ